MIIYQGLLDSCADLIYIFKLLRRNKSCLRQHLINLVDAIIQQVFALHYRTVVVAIALKFPPDKVHKFLALMRLVHGAHKVSVHGTNLLAKEELL